MDKIAIKGRFRTPEELRQALANREYQALGGLADAASRATPEDEVLKKTKGMGTHRTVKQISERTRRQTKAILDRMDPGYVGEGGIAAVKEMKREARSSSNRLSKKTLQNDYKAMLVNPKLREKVQENASKNVKRTTAPRAAQQVETLSLLDKVKKNKKAIGVGIAGGAIAGALLHLLNKKKEPTQEELYYNGQS